MAQQTAVEWFFEVLAHNDIIDHKKLCDDENLYNLLYSLKNQAKQMEEDQKYETSAFWFGRGVLAGKENRIEELKPTKE